MIFVTIFIFFITVLNSYTLFGTWKHFKKPLPNRLWRGFLIFMPLWEIVAVILMSYQFQPDFGKSSLLTNTFMGVSFSFFLTKLTINTFLFINDGFRLLKWPVQSIAKRKPVPLEGRRRFVTNVGLVLAAVPFTGLLYGTFKGKYNYKVWKHKLSFKELPTSFDGLRIAQISDIHSGSFDDPEAVRKGLRALMEYKPDLILLTGDLVNNFATEMDGLIDLFDKELDAPFGKYAVMGNHDYGEYVQWDSEEEKEANVAAVREQYAKIGFKLLDNEATVFELHGEKISLIGVENWGGGSFPKYGDYDLASKKIDSNSFKILMSHDPEHWDQHIIDHDHFVHLTLSGHTHGAQMGVEIPGWIKWSPVSLRYQRWAGLYEEKDQYLYVNRGFGFIGYPGRIGIWPEITILDLHQA
jgi:predicted MPP superfamily phosphohydrolase